jgi:HlyD family secretion protein
VWKWIIGILIVIALIIGGAATWLLGFGGMDTLKTSMTGMAGGELPIEVRLEEAKRGDLVRTVNAPGAIEPQTSVEISAQVSSKIIALPFNEGDTVRKGDVVVRLDSEDTLARLDAARSQLAVQEAQLDGVRASLILAEADVGRLRELFESSDIPKSDLDATEARYLQAKSALAAAEAGLLVAQAEIAEREKDLANTVISSPIDGVVTRQDAEVGEQVLGTLQAAGTVILEIADLSRMVMRARVDEANIGPVRPGQKARIYLTQQMDQPFEGTVEHIKLTRDIERDGTGYFEAEILVELPEEERRRIGRNGNCDIEVETIREAIKIPSQAVLDRRIDELPKEIVDGNPIIDKNKTFARVVYRIVDGKAQATPVTTGLSDLTHAVILAGLEDSEKIITGPYKVLLALKHGQAVAEEGTLKKPGDKPDDKPATPATETAKADQK